jgi:predicted deacylase
VAELVDPSVEDHAAARMPLFAGTDGILFGRMQQRFARAGEVVVKIAGPEPLPGKGNHLLTNR